MKLMDIRSVSGDRAGRLLQMALAIYLIPALLVVLVASAVGMLILTVGRLFANPLPRSAG